MKQLKLTVLTFFLLALVGTSIKAQDANNPWAVSIGVNVVDAAYDSRSFGTYVEDYFGPEDWSDSFISALSRVSGEKYLDKGFSINVAASIARFESRASGRQDDPTREFDLLYYAFDANVKYSLDAAIKKVFGGSTQYFDPFVLVGGGYTSVDDVGEGTLNAGYGFNIWLNETVGFQFQSAAKFEFANKILNHWQHSLGVVFKFGGKDTDGDGIYDKDDACPDVAGLKEFNGCPDADGDGITDAEDSCPDVAGPKELNGCPDADGDGVADKDDMCPNSKGSKANNGCPDTDGDGVLDKDDKCATVAGPTANAGCPWPDTDGDGVLDKDDKCSTVVGPASNNGCPIPVISKKDIEVIEFQAKLILFNSGSSSFKRGVTKQLDEIVKIMNKNARATFAVEGHTDSTGSDKLNKKLSEKRASAVKDYLIKNGIDVARLTSKGYGEEYPIADNNTRDGRTKNRRVEIKLTN